MPRNLAEAIQIVGEPKVIEEVLISEFSDSDASNLRRKMLTHYARINPEPLIVTCSNDAELGPIVSTPFVKEDPKSIIERIIFAYTGKPRTILPPYIRPTAGIEASDADRSGELVRWSSEKRPELLKLLGMNSDNDFLAFIREKSKAAEELEVDKPSSFVLNELRKLVPNIHEYLEPAQAPNPVHWILANPNTRVYGRVLGNDTIRTAIASRAYQKYHNIWGIATDVTNEHFSPDPEEMFTLR